MAIATMTLDPNAYSEPNQIADDIVAQPVNERRIVVTQPNTGEHRVVAVKRTSDGKLAAEYDDTPES